MRKILSSSAFSLLLIFTSIQVISGQYSKVEEITLFSTRIASPIVMDVQKSSTRIVIDAISKSYFTYEFTISFQVLQNLSPRIFEYHTKVHFGRNRIYVFEVADKSQPFSYGYTTSFILSSADRVETDYPYLIPIGKGKSVKLKEVQQDRNIIYYLNQFKMSPNDTVFAIRKGTVIALPDNKTEVERIFKSASLEILHNDGTIAIFLGLNPDVTFLKLGQSVYPGQPVGIIGSTETLTLHVVAPKENGRIENLSVNFSGQDGSILPSDKIRETKVIYTKSTVQKEMSSKEIKKLEKGTLY